MITCSLRKHRSRTPQNFYSGPNCKIVDLKIPWPWIFRNHARIIAVDDDTVKGWYRCFLGYHFAREVPFHLFPTKKKKQKKGLVPKLSEATHPRNFLSLAAWRAKTLQPTSFVPSGKKKKTSNLNLQRLQWQVLLSLRPLVCAESMIRPCLWISAPLHTPPDFCRFFYHNRQCLQVCQWLFLFLKFTASTVLRYCWAVRHCSLCSMRKKKYNATQPNGRGTQQNTPQDQKPELSSRGR